MRIVYVGPLWEGGTCRMRMEALKTLGHDVVPVDTTPPESIMRLTSLAARVLAKLGWPRDLAGANAQIRLALDAGATDVLWLDKGLTIRPDTLAYASKKLLRPVIVNYSPDDMGSRHNQSRWYLNALPLLDVHFTTKTFNVPELESLGARRVVFVGNGYDPNTHRPVPVSPVERQAFGGPVGFIGAYEQERAGSMLNLARAGIPVRVWGWADWRPVQGRHANLVVENQPLWGDDYAKAICSFAINLCFLRKVNRDRQTQRSVEIPACGGFMLAERTDEHLELFEEGKEAEFFASDHELVDKAGFYVRHESLRQRIAAAGRERCIRSGYDYPSRMRWMLAQMEHLCAG